MVNAIINLSEHRHFLAVFSCLFVTLFNPFILASPSAQPGSDAVKGKVIYQSMEIFPLVKQHVHAPTIVELPNGSLLAAWYQGSGEQCG